MSDKYFRAQGKSLEIFEAYWKTREAVLAEWKKISDEVGADGIMANDHLAGFTFEAVPPEPWDYALMKSSGNGHDYWKPNKRRKMGKELDLWMRQHVMPASYELTTSLLGFPVYNTSKGMVSLGFPP